MSSNQKKLSPRKYACLRSFKFEVDVPNDKGSVEISGQAISKIKIGKTLSVHLNEPEETIIGGVKKISIRMDINTQESPKVLRRSVELIQNNTVKKTTRKLQKNTGRIHKNRHRWSLNRIKKGVVKNLVQYLDDSILVTQARPRV